MTKPINTRSIEKATGKPWVQWVEELDARGARELEHKELARQLYDELNGKLDNHGWWAQGITVAYEQHIGKRVPGQLASGLFEVAVSKTVTQTRGEFFPRVAEWFESQSELDGREVLRQRSSETPKRSTWRCNFADKSRFSATVEGIDGGRSKLVLAHTDIPTRQDADAWKEYWRSVLDKLGNYKDKQRL